MGRIIEGGFNELNPVNKEDRWGRGLGVSMR